MGWWEIIGERWWIVGNWSDDERDRCPPRNKMNIRIRITKIRIRINMENIIMIVKPKRDWDIGTRISRNRKFSFKREWENIYFCLDYEEKVIDRDK